MGLIHFDGMDAYLTQFQRTDGDTALSRVGAATSVSPTEYSAALIVYTGTSVRTSRYPMPTPVTSGGIGFRIKRDSESVSYNGSILSLNDASLQSVIQLKKPSGGTNWALIHDGATLYTLTDPGDSLWHYYEILWTGSSVKLYQDGGLIYSGEVAIPSIAFVDIYGVAYATYIFDDFYACDMSPGLVPPLGPITVRHYKPSALSAPDWLNATGGAPSLSHLTDNNDATYAFADSAGKTLDLDWSMTVEGSILSSRLAVRASNSGSTAGVNGSIEVSGVTDDLGDVSVFTATPLNFTFMSETSPDGDAWVSSDFLDVLTRFTTL